MNNVQVHKTWSMLRMTYTLVPILLGIDKFFSIGFIVDWSKYVSPTVMEYMPLTMAQLLMLVGVIEILAGFVVWFYPRFGGCLVAAWLGVIIVNLATMYGMYDIIARDVVIAIGALALAGLSKAMGKK